jgi:hypothetical protein
MLEVNYTAQKMKEIATEYKANLQNKEVDEYLKRILAAAAGGLFYLDIKDNLTKSQISRFEELGYIVNKLIEGFPAYYRICWK